MTLKCCERVYNKLVFTGCPSDGVTIPKAVSPVELKSPVVTPDKVSSEEQQHLDEENRGKPGISGSTFDPGTEPDFLYIRFCHCMLYSLYSLYIIYIIPLYSVFIIFVFAIVLSLLGVFGFL